MFTDNLQLLQLLTTSVSLHNISMVTFIIVTIIIPVQTEAQQVLVLMMRLLTTWIFEAHQGDSSLCGRH